MKNVLKIEVSGQTLLYSTDDGTNTLIINGSQIASSNWVGTGNYTTTVNGHMVTIAKVASASGNLILAQTAAYTYEFRAKPEESPVTGVKGDQEATYRTGNVNLTPANIGAVSKAGDTMTGDLTVSATGTSTMVNTENGNNHVSLYASSNYLGLYSIDVPGMIMYKDLADGQLKPTATTAANGFMSAADKTKLNGMSLSFNNSASGPTAKSIASGTSEVNLFDTAVTLTAGHKYCINYMIQWSSNANGRRYTQLYIGSSTAGIIALDSRPAVDGAVTICRGQYWYTVGSSNTSFMIKGYQNSGSSLTATVRYQLVDFGTT